MNILEDPTRRARILEVIRQGGTQADAAGALGISRVHLSRCLAWAREAVDGWAVELAAAETDARAVRLASRVVVDAVPVERRLLEPRDPSGRGIMARDELLERISDAARNPEDPAYVLSLKLLYDRIIGPENAAACARAKREVSQERKKTPNMAGSRGRVLEAVNRAKPAEDA